MYYRKNKELAVTHTTQPTLTDQSAAHETDRNVIMSRYMIHGQMPGSAKQPMYADFAALPGDLRGFLDHARSLKTLRGQLPTQLQKHSLEELLALTPEQLTTILTPPPLTMAPKDLTMPGEEKK